jgi:hypothetical protein
MTAPDFFGGRLAVVRGMTRYAVNLLVILNIFLFVGLVATNFAWMQHADRLAAKQWIAYEVGPQGTLARDAADLQSGPLPVEARARAWEIVRLILGADATAENDAAANFRKARLLMTARLADEFDRSVAPTAADVQAMRLARVVEARPEDVRPCAAGEFPDGRDARAPGFHYVVRCKITAYRLGDNEPVLGGTTAYYVNLVPDVRGRSIQNPSGLLVAALVPLSPGDLAPKPGKDSANAPN